ncbi:NAD-dependent epimerase/dehydratase family protein [Streptomyces sp. NPDC058625]|uniref:NAD-dependent epimerase/dehydratase family protein n=1 Tax=Streptomyces sp. NPDC058625 TaxID=3346564 RepID=UPI0036592B81
MNLLVTGAAGFIGSRHVRRLLAAGAPRTTVLDALTYAGTLDNLELAQPRVEFVHGDIRDADLVGTLTAEADQVVHFAAESQVDRSILTASDFVLTHVPGARVLPDTALRRGVDTFVHVFTDEVHGSIASGSATEAYPIEPSSPCSASKASSGLLALAHHRTHGLDVRVTRCPEAHPTAPRTAYGRSKPAGARAVPEELSGASAVVRTAWMYGVHGTGFVRTMTGLEARRPTVDVVDDQHGQPPGARTSPLARPTSALASATTCTASCMPPTPARRPGPTWSDLAREVPADARRPRPGTAHHPSGLPPARTPPRVQRPRARPPAGHRPAGTG